MMFRTVIIFTRKITNFDIVEVKSEFIPLVLHNID